MFDLGLEQFPLFYYYYYRHPEEPTWDPEKFHRRNTFFQTLYMASNVVSLCWAYREYMARSQGIGQHATHGPHEVHVGISAASSPPRDLPINPLSYFTWPEIMCPVLAATVHGALKVSMKTSHLSKHIEINTRSAYKMFTVSFLEPNLHLMVYSYSATMAISNYQPQNMPII